MGADHERFLNQHAGAITRGEQRVGLGRRKRDRLFTQHVFARLDGADRPGHVQVIGQRIVDNLDVAVGQQLLVRSIRPGNAGRRRGRARLLRISRGNRRHLRPPAAVHCRDDFLHRDLGDAEHAPPDFLSHVFRVADIAHRSDQATMARENNKSDFRRDINPA